MNTAMNAIAAVLSDVSIVDIQAAITGVIGPFFTPLHLFKGREPLKRSMALYKMHGLRYLLATRALLFIISLVMERERIAKEK